MVKKIVKLVVLLFILIQFYRPSKNISTEVSAADFLKITNANESVSTMFKTSCYDCHSNNTEYPWYAEVAPISWMVAHHVDEGKEELNFSEWNTFSQKRKEKKLDEMIEMLEEREMPLKTYLPMHSEAKLSDAQNQKLIDWIKSLQ